MSVLAHRVSRFGTTVFSEFSALAAKHGAVNLGQGFPDFDGPEEVKEAAQRAIRDGVNQYADAREAGGAEANQYVLGVFIHSDQQQVRNFQTVVALSEYGITPVSDIVLGPWETWTEFEEECGISRLWGGVHFRASIPAGRDLCRPIGDLAYEFVQDHIAGNVP